MRLLMKATTLLGLLFTATTLTAACDDSATPDPNPAPEFPSELVATAQLTEAQQARAAAYRAASLEGERLRNGVYVYSTTVKAYADAPERLAARIALMGFRDVYLSAQKTMIVSADKWLRTFIATFAGYGGETWSVRISSTNLLFDPSKVDDEVALVKEYNSRVAPNERFAGISADLEPHIQKDQSKEYFWNSTTNNGVGGPNDRLLQRTIECLSRADRALEPLRLCEAVWYNYQIFNDRGDLSYGDVSHFLGACDFVIIMAYRNSKEAIMEKSLPTLKAAQGHPRTVSIAIKTALNGLSDQSSSIGHKGWDYLLETVEHLRIHGPRYDAFRGIDNFTWEGLEKLWLE